LSNTAVSKDRGLDDLRQFRDHNALTIGASEEIANVSLNWEGVRRAGWRETVRPVPGGPGGEIPPGYSTGAFMKAPKLLILFLSLVKSSRILRFLNALYHF